MVILASGSPRRQELLKLVYDEFEVIPSDIDESLDIGGSIERYPEILAEKKACCVAKNAAADDIVIGCDTGVFIDGEMLGKPQSESEAFAMIKRLSGRTHSVITGCCVISSGVKISFSQTTQVSFYDLSDREIADYVATGEPMDKAGAYGIQGLGALLVNEISGDFYNVVGLPISRLRREIDNMFK